MLPDEKSELQGEQGFPGVSLLIISTGTMHNLYLTKDSPAIISWAGGDPEADLSWQNVSCISTP